MSADYVNIFKSTATNPFDALDLSNPVDYFFQNEIKIIRDILPLLARKSSDKPLTDDDLLNGLLDLSDGINKNWVNPYLDLSIEGDHITDNPLCEIFNRMRAFNINTAIDSDFDVDGTREEFNYRVSLQYIAFFLKLHASLKYLLKSPNLKNITKDVFDDLVSLGFYDMDFSRLSILAGQCFGFAYGHLLTSGSIPIALKSEKSKAGKGRSARFKELKDFCYKHYLNMKSKNPNLSNNRAANLLSAKIDNEFDGVNNLSDYSRLDTLRKWVRAFDKGGTN